ncbi:hypothetical protein [Pseudomonas sp. BF-R-24]|uniref:hypothetical protein n=1 Tax=Pseudomonas sp. BF-R-24 TaxID=2832386 RepID=UPI001CBDF63D|nr:hypothetical protein [Pseudomonas sp. BF-R-24]
MSNDLEESGGKPFIASADESFTEQQTNYEIDRLPPPPVILAPRAYSSNPAGHLIITGTCERGAAVVVLTSKGKLGDAVVVNDHWFYCRVWGEEAYPPGMLVNAWYGWIGRGADIITIAVRQYIDGLPSSLAQVKAVKIGGVEASPASTTPISSENSEFFSGASDAVHYSDSGCSNTQENFFIDEVFGGTRDNLISTVQSLPEPTVTWPKEGTSFLLGQAIELSGTCLEGATVLASAQYYFESYGPGSSTASAEVDGTEWNRQVILGMNRYPEFVLLDAQQWIGNSFSPWSRPVRISFEMVPPKIVFPLAGSTHPAGGIYLSGVCDYYALVKIWIMGEADPESAVVVGNTWVYYREFTKGSKHVRVTQTIGGKTSKPSDVFEFTVE